MSSLVEYYKLLGVSAGAGLVDITTSYRRLCRIYHPDVNKDPDSEELMKRINIAYSALREKLGRDAAVRERTGYSRAARRYTPPDAHKTAAAADFAADREASAVLNAYFDALCRCDYKKAYDCLSEFDKRHIPEAGFDGWRKSVSRLYPMRDFKIAGKSKSATMTFGDSKSFKARRFNVSVTEENLARDVAQTGEIEKLVINENGAWRVFLGYKDVSMITRTFEEKFEAKKRRDIALTWQEHYTRLYPEYNMLSLKGLRKAASREIYRQQRYGGALTFAALSVKSASGGGESTLLNELLRSAAKTINRSLRETDVSAYTGDGVFAFLLVQLKEENAPEVVGRIAERIKKDAGERLSKLIEIDFMHESFAEPASKEALDKILRKYQKRL